MSQYIRFKGKVDNTIRTELIANVFFNRSDLDIEIIFVEGDGASEDFVLSDTEICSLPEDRDERYMEILYQIILDALVSESKLSIVELPVKNG